MTRERRLKMIERLLREEYVEAFDTAKTRGDGQDTVQRMVACLRAKEQVDKLQEIES